jgi:hypothetical protein
VDAIDAGHLGALHGVLSSSSSTGCAEWGTHTSVPSTVVIGISLALSYSF